MSCPRRSPAWKSRPRHGTGKRGCSHQSRAFRAIGVRTASRVWWTGARPRWHWGLRWKPRSGRRSLCGRHLDAQLSVRAGWITNRYDRTRPQNEQCSVIGAGPCDDGLRNVARRKLFHSPPKLLRRSEETDPCLAGAPRVPRCGSFADLLGFNTRARRTSLVAAGIFQILVGTAAIVLGLSAKEFYAAFIRRPKPDEKAMSKWLGGTIFVVVGIGFILSGLLDLRLPRPPLRPPQRLTLPP